MDFVLQYDVLIELIFVVVFLNDKRISLHESKT